jgi:hypothetical protein
MTGHATSRVIPFSIVLAYRRNDKTGQKWRSFAAAGSPLDTARELCDYRNS